MAPTVAAQEPMDLAEPLAPEAEATLSWGDNFDLVDLLHQEFAGPTLRQFHWTAWRE